MQDRLRMLALAATLILGATAGCDRPSQGKPDAHGHDQGDEKGLEPISVTFFTSKVLLFMEYPHLVQGEQAEFLAHFSVLSTGEPVRSGSLVFEVTPPNGSPVNLTLEEPRRDGLFVPEWVFKTPGEHRLRLLLSSPQVQDAVDVGSVIVHATAHDAEHAAEATAGDEPPDLVPFLLEQQWKIELLLATASRHTLTHRITAPARIVPKQGTSAVASPPIAGRLSPPNDAHFPHVGQRVEAGEVLAFVEPPLPATDAAQLIANRAWIQALELEIAFRKLDLNMKTAEIEKAVRAATAKLDFAKRTRGRADDLRQKGVGTDQQFDKAEQDLRLAQAEHDAAMASKRANDEVRTQLGELRAGTGIDFGMTEGHAARPRMPIKAPISGVVVKSASVEGEQVEAHAPVFRIVNAHRIWVRANVSEFDLGSLTASPGATLSLSAFPGWQTDILSEAGGRFVHLGTVVDESSRVVPITYELPNPDGRFRIGMLAEVQVATKTAEEVVAIPEEAVVMDNGRPIAFVMLEGETFQRRELELGIRDNGFVEIKSGVEVGERVATKGSYALKLASQSPSSFGAGHVH
ncbi:MAG: efflux RND transporter periplasmic adaptor subunit [Phycisphaerae bacterium]